MTLVNGHTTSQPASLPIEPPPQKVSARFADFELDLDTFELTRAGRAVDLQPQPGRLLALLISSDGQTVRREQIRRQIWGEDTHVEYEQAINFTIRKIRQALGDSASTPRFVETVPKVGYRFVAPVVLVDLQPKFDTSPSAAIAGAAMRTVETPDAAAEDSTIDFDGGTLVGRLEPFPRASATSSVDSLGAQERPRSRARALLTTLFLVLTATGLFVWLRQEVRGLPSSPAVSSPDLPQPNSTSRPAAPPGHPEAQRQDIGPTQQRLLEAQHWIANPHLGKTQDAVDQLLRILAGTPDLAPAHLELAQGYLELGGQQRFSAFMPQVAKAAERAIELKPNLARAHYLKAVVLFFYHHRWREAEAASQETLRLEPEFPMGIHLRGIILSARGRHEQGLANLRRAVELDPGTLWIVSDLAFGKFYAGDLTSALEITTTNLRTDPEDPTNLFLHASARLLIADDAAAARAMAKTHPGAADASVAEALDWHIAAVELRLEMGLRGHTTLATLHALAGRDDDAMKHLLLACNSDPGWELPFVGVDPRFERVRSRPDFAQLSDCLPPQG